MEVRSARLQALCTLSFLRANPTTAWNGGLFAREPGPGSKEVMSVEGDLGNSGQIPEYWTHQIPYL